MPVHVSYFTLNVEMYDQIVHTETFTEEKNIAAGDWSYSFNFVPPSVYGKEKISLAMFAIDSTKVASLFEIDTVFYLSSHTKKDTKFV